MPPESTHTRTHTLTTWFEFRAFSTAVGTSLNKEVMVKMLSGSVIWSECLVGLDPEAELIVSKILFEPSESPLLNQV